MTDAAQVADVRAADRGTTALNACLNIPASFFSTRVGGRSAVIRSRPVVDAVPRSVITRSAYVPR